MKKLSQEGYHRARLYLRAEGRPLEQSLFRQRFEGAPAEEVKEDLAAFRNPDGGFGHALEPDVRTPASSALATGIALNHLRDLRAPATDPMVRDAVAYLLETFDAGRGVWRVIPPEANESPHAPWWGDEEGSLARTFDHFLVIPRAELLSLLSTWSELLPAGWLEPLMVRTVDDIEKLEIHQFGGGGDTLVYAQSLLNAPTLPAAPKLRLRRKLRAVADVVVQRDPSHWDTYCVLPLKLAPAPASPLADLLWDSIRVHLDYTVAGQAHDGAWEPNWSWGGLYPADWETARREWRGILTLNALTTLRAWGRVEGL